MPEQFPKYITEIFTLPLSLEKFGLYSISITARCKVDEELRVEIGDLKLREIPPTENIQYNKIPPTWNGTELKGLSKTVVFLAPLNQGDNLNFIPTKGAQIERCSVQQILNLPKISFAFNDQAEDGNGRPWYTFALINLSLHSITADVSIQWHYWDGDNVKLIVDGNVEPNSISKQEKNWIWSASWWPPFFTTKREQKQFVKDLPQGIHYIEFWADKTPTLHQVIFNLGTTNILFPAPPSEPQPPTKRVPTEDNPEWTKNLNDDSDTILLARLVLGEAENQSKKTKLGVACSVINRVSKQRTGWGLTIREALLKPSQYNGLWGERYERVRNPLANATPKQKIAWKESYEVAQMAIAGSAIDPTLGATHFHSFRKNFPPWATAQYFKIKLGDISFYELEK